MPDIIIREVIKVQEVIRHHLTGHQEVTRLPDHIHPAGVIRPVVRPVVTLSIPAEDDRTIFKNTM